jgi:transcription antitermination factor NusG
MSNSLPGPLDELGLEGAKPVMISRDWYAIRVKSRGEKSSAANIAVRGIECFWPTYETKRRWSDRVKVIEEPLFSGYVFCQVPDSRFLPVISSPGVLQVVGAVEPHEMSAMRRLVEGGAAVPWPYLQDGQRVRMRNGAWQGLEGILQSAGGRDRVVVNIELLQKAVAVEVDRDMIEPCR